MNHKFALLISVLILWSGCTTLPKPIDDVYLNEKTEEQTAKFNNISAEIIASKTEKDKVEKDFDAALIKIEISRKEIAQNEAANSLLLEKEKLYTETKDPRLADIPKQREQNRIRGEQERMLLEYRIAKMNEINALLEVKKNELAVKVAELDYLKATIAKEYQMKRIKEYKNKMIDDMEYKKFVDDQKIKLMENQNNHKRAGQEVSTTVDKLKKSGYEKEI